jgi:L-threonylcarbamoyladenylate synthase
VVAVPTDALYALVADPFSLRAVSQVYQAKGREAQRSLPLLVSDIMMAEELAAELNNRFYILARRFWPGPLTLIVPAAARLPLKVTGNTGRLALRHSPSKVAEGLLARLNHPLIARRAAPASKCSA